MKRINNITSIILFIVIAFCSCKVYGQHKQKKQLLKEIKYGVPLTKKQINVTASPSGVTVTYNGSSTTPTNAGSYAVEIKPSFTDYSGKKYKSDFWDEAFSILLSSLWYIIPLSIVFLILLTRRNEEITMQDDFEENFDNEYQKIKP